MTKVIAGIDLGTTYSAIAVLDDTGNPEILPDIKNNKITPSAVYVSKDNKILVGNDAIQKISEEPARVVTEIKSKMRDECVYSTKTAQWIDKKFNEKNDDEFTPAQLSSKILEKLKNLKEDVEQVVITVPAMFAQRAREATLDAAKIAGLSGYEGDAVELINEPTAAIFHYANLQKSPIIGKVMVFDLGGGTFDVTIADVNGKKVDVIHSEGNPNLGGKDFDRNLLEYMSETYEKDLGAKLKIDDEEFLLQAEQIKKNLSMKDNYSFSINGPNGISKEITISRKEFADLNDSLLEAINLKLLSCLKKSYLGKDDISQILLVGGSTRMPCILELIKNTLGKEATKGVNVDEAVASGAALYAGTLAGLDILNINQQEVISELELSDVANHYFGTRMITSNFIRDRDIVVNDIIIEKGDKLPAAKTKKYVLSGDTNSFNATVNQSDGPTSDLNFVNQIAQEEVKIENGKKDDPVEITFSYDKSQNMQCTFLHVPSDTKHEIHIKNLSTKDVDKAKKEMNKFHIE